MKLFAQSVINNLEVLDFQIFRQNGQTCSFCFFMIDFFIKKQYNIFAEGEVMFNFEELKSLSEMQKQIVYCL